MAIEIKMPQLSDTMSAGKILAWKKKEGDTISRGDILAEVETDKANLEIESFHQGVLLKIMAPADSNATVGQIIAIIGQPGESLGAYNGTPTAQPQATAPQPSAASTPSSSLANSGAPSIPSASPAASSSNRIKASPLARKIAEAQHIDLSTISGTGPEGRIVKKDVEGRTSSGSATPSPANGAVPSHGTVPQQSSIAPREEPRTSQTITGGRLTPLSKMRETIARRMQQAVVEAPHFYVTASIDMTEAKRTREILKEQPEFQGLSINHFIIKAAAYALSKEPRVNRAMKEGMLYEPDQINIGIITAVPDGLLIPVIKETDKLSLKDIVFEAKAAVERARAGRPSASDLLGGTFSISNMGMFDVESFTAIINPGQGGVLAVSSILEVPVVKYGIIVPGLQMKATVSVDHRVIDGVMAGTFLKHFKSALETPALMLA